MFFIFTYIIPQIFAQFLQLNVIEKPIEIFIPFNTSIEDSIYRLNALDYCNCSFEFNIIENSIVLVKAVSEYEVDIILKEPLELDLSYDFLINITNVNSLYFILFVTNFSNNLNNVFPGAPRVLTVSEAAPVGQIIGFTTIKCHDINKSVSVTTNSSEFGIAIEKHFCNIQAKILLTEQLDYESQILYYVKITTTNPAIQDEIDTRNIMFWNIIIVVLDEEDMPPVFISLPTMINLNMTTEDRLCQVSAKDGDFGKSSDILYGIEDNGVISKYFNINKKTGDIYLEKPTLELTNIVTNQLLEVTVTAQEISSKRISKSTILFILPNESPKFSSEHYNLTVDENSAIGTKFPIENAEIKMFPPEILLLEIVNCNSTFNITPSVIFGNTKFEITIYNSSMLDFETITSFNCDINCKERNGTVLVQSKITIVLNNLNDNEPQFFDTKYIVKIPENSPVGTIVVTIQANDSDGSPFCYTNLSGIGSDFFYLDEENGSISIINSTGIDAEFELVTLVKEKTFYYLTATVSDEDGLTSSVPIEIQINDLNDCSPIFTADIFMFFVFTTRNTKVLYGIEAYDKDISSINNDVTYSLDSTSNFTSIITVDYKTGEVVLKSYLLIDTLTLNATAQDNGNPPRIGTCQLSFYSIGYNLQYKITGENFKPNKLAKLLDIIQNGFAHILSINSYKNNGITYNEGIFTLELAKAFPRKWETFLTDIGEELSEIRTVRKVEILQSSNNNLVVNCIILFVGLILLLTCTLVESCPLNKKIREIRLMNEKSRIAVNRKVQVAWIDDTIKEH